MFDPDSNVEKLGLETIKNVFFSYKLYFHKKWEGGGLSFRIFFTCYP